MRRCVAGLLSLALLTLMSAGTALAQKRIALVIGNSSYTAVAALANPKNDATAIAGLLRRIGFDSVELALDQTGEAMRGQLSAFAQKSTGADVALVYYAGHGIEVGGVNYLLPVDAQNLTSTTISLQAIALESVMSAIADTRHLKLVILDACRDNPFAAMLRRTGGTRSVGQGLARLEPASSETLVAYAAREGTVALDGDEANSPYTEALLRHLGEPDLDVRLAFGRVRDDVMQKTNRRQEPFVYGSLGGQVTPLVRGVAPATQGAQQTSQPLAPQSAPSPVVAAIPANPPAPATSPAPLAAVGGGISAADVRRIQEFAAKQNVPVPSLEFKVAKSTRSLSSHALVGVWGSDIPWGGRGRQVVLAITTVNDDGTVRGVYSYGPPGGGSWQSFPAGNFAFTARPEGNKITVKRADTYTFELDANGAMNGIVTSKSGIQSGIVLNPLWRPSGTEAARPKR